MSATPEDRRDAQNLRKAVDIAEGALGLSPGAYDDERITIMYLELYGECNMTMALRWGKLLQEGKTTDEAYAQIQQQFAK